MISVLIPVFNIDVTGLVRELNSQLMVSGISYEVLLVDDASEPGFQRNNRLIADGVSVIYYQSPVNRGRIATRNLLSEMARYEWLLFLDADSIIISRSFIADYLAHACTDVQVITGGRTYTEKIPADCRYRLHWSYGRKRESKAGISGHSLYVHFMSNNFLIRRSVFQGLIFPAYLKGYGHEDTWMGMQFERWGVKLKRINNPVLHNELEAAGPFLSKTRNSIRNIKLMMQFEDGKLLAKHVRLIWAYTLLKKTGSIKPFKIIYHQYQDKITRNLIGCRPSLFYFDLFKLKTLIDELRSP